MPVRRPEMICPICKERCTGGLDLQRHLADFHSEEQVAAAREEVEAVETEALNGDVRRQERLDNFIEFGGG